MLTTGVVQSTQVLPLKSLSVPGFCFPLPLLTSQASAFVAGQFQEMLDGHPKASLPLSRQISLYKRQCSELLMKPTHVHRRSPALEFLGSSFGQEF